MNHVKWNKVFLSFGLAILLGLLISLKLLQASSKEEELPLIDSVATKAVEDYDFNEAINADILEKIKTAEEERTLLPITATLLKNLQRECHKKGEPFLWLSHEKGLYPVNAKGELLMANQSAPVFDAPILSGNGLKINPKSHRLEGRSFSEAVVFIRSLKRQNQLLAQKLSELHCDSSIGLIAYFSHTGTLPVVIGHGEIEKKSKRIALLLEQMGHSQLVSFAKYIDARYDKQLIIKKNS